MLIDVANLGVAVLAGLAAVLGLRASARPRLVIAVHLPAPADIVRFRIGEEAVMSTDVVNVGSWLARPAATNSITEFELPGFLRACELTYQTREGLDRRVVTAERFGSLVVRSSPMDLHAGERCRLILRFPVSSSFTGPLHIRSTTSNGASAIRTLRLASDEDAA